MRGKPPDTDCVRCRPSSTAIIRFALQGMSVVPFVFISNMADERSVRCVDQMQLVVSRKVVPRPRWNCCNPLLSQSIVIRFANTNLFIAVDRFASVKQSAIASQVPLPETTAAERADVENRNWRRSSMCRGPIVVL